MLKEPEHSRIHNILTKHEVKMAGYWPNSLFSLVMDWDNLELIKINQKNKKTMSRSTLTKQAKSLTLCSCIHVNFVSLFSHSDTFTIKRRTYMYMHVQHRQCRRHTVIYSEVTHGNLFFQKNFALIGMAKNENGHASHLYSTATW